MQFTITPTFSMNGERYTTTHLLVVSESMQGEPQAIGRCSWPSSALSIQYHDLEWGVPLHDDRKFFEFIVLDGAQAGLSWETILRKREQYRIAFDGFIPEVVARYGDDDVSRLLANPGIVRNRLKIASAIRNARAFLEVQREFGTFDAYIWQFTGGQTIQNRFLTTLEIPARTAESDTMSKALQQRGFNFVGSTICYAFMQAAGMVNDHLVDCFRYREVQSGGAAPSPEVTMV